mgnify:CR=1 FL=1
MKKLFIFFVWLLVFSFSFFAQAQTWQNLEIPEAKPMEKNALAKMIETEMPGLSGRILTHPTLVRIEVTGGTGVQKISETVFLFKNIPALAWLKAESDLKGSRETITFAPFKSCTWEESSQVHDCKGAGVANTGPVDVLNVVSQKHALLVSRAKTAGRAKTILWLAYDSGASIYYLPYSSMGFDKLGTDTVQVTSYVPTAANVPMLPPDPIDIASNPTTPESQPPPSNPPDVQPTETLSSTEPSPMPPSTDNKQLPPQETAANWKGFSVLQPRTIKMSLLDVWRQDRLGHLVSDAQLRQYHWVRIHVKGVDLNTAKSLRLALPAPPAMAYVFAWTDKLDEKRFYLGDLSQCLQNAGKGCPIRVDGKKWYDLSGRITTTRFVAQATPNTAGSAQMILWLAFSAPVKEIGYIHTKNGAISAVAWSAAADTATETPLASAASSVNGLPQDGPMQLKLIPKTVAYPKVSSYLRSVGLVPQDSGLLAYPYLVRIHIKPSSLQARAMEIRLPSNPAVVLGTSIPLTSNAGYSMVQIGQPSKCRIRGHQMHCPMHFHGLGWRDLSGGFVQGKTRLILSANASTHVQDITLLMAFEQKPNFVQVVEYPTDDPPTKMTTALYHIQQFR